MCSLDPNWVAGFVDGEGCFSVPVRRNPMAPHGWQLQPTFQVSQHRSNRALLEALVDFFGCGAVRSKGPNSSVDVFNVWRLDELEELNSLIHKAAQAENLRELIIRSLRWAHKDFEASFQRIACA